MFVGVSSFRGLADDTARATTFARMLTGPTEIAQAPFGILFAERSPFWLFGSG
jgi:hypothetical protein